MRQKKILWCMYLSMIFCVEHHIENRVSYLDRLCWCDPSKNEWGVIITMHGLGWAHRAAQVKVIFTHNLLLLRIRFPTVESHPIKPRATIVEIQIWIMLTDNLLIVEPTDLDKIEHDSH